tara:strand:- start:11 stop:1105 length:1095 start_codon:yes stop_codon:yes gene_type:complete
MNVYWGYANSGKSHMEVYYKSNGMNVLTKKKSNFMKTKIDVHNRGVTPRGNYWIYRDLQKKIYGRDGDKFISSETPIDTNVKKFHFMPGDSYINPLSKSIYNFYMSLKKLELRTIADDEKRTFTDEDIKKFTGDEYKGSDLYNIAIMEHIIGKEFEDLGYDMLNDNADEIFDDVDIVMTKMVTNFSLRNPYGQEDGRGFCEKNFLLQEIGQSKEYRIPENVLNKLRKANNVIPYKSDIFSFAISYIDSFSHLTGHRYDEEQLIIEKDLYDKNIKLIFKFLDHHLHMPIKIAEFLTKRNIPYRYFDLDNDSYNEVFGGNFEIDRDYTNHSSSWKNYPDRHNQVLDMAKLWISERNLPSYYTPNKL